MASSSTEIRKLEGILSTLLNKQLQTICATHGLRTSGVKAELQNRIKHALSENYRSDLPNFASIRNTIMSIRDGHANSSSMGGGPSSSTTSASRGQGQVKQNYHHYQGGVTPTAQPYVPGFGSSGSSAGGYRSTPQAASGLHFKPTPFYTIDSRIGDIRSCDVMSQHRNSIHMSVKASDHPALGRCSHDKSMRIMVFCASDNQGPQDISFPHQSEIKVNGGEIKANLRGLKGKPGSTRPVDITDLLRLKPNNYANTVEFTYALTTKVKKYHPSQAQKYYLALYLCKMVSVDDLVAKIKGKKIAKASVIQELSKKANDPDIVATSSVLSLKCPLTYMRLDVPCRSISCTHIQCFNANSYLLLQEQGPQWLCPICNKSAPFENLAVDEYVKDILENTSHSLEQVTIEPDGKWRIQKDEPEPKKPRYSGASANMDDDDDLSIVSDSRGFSNGIPSGTNGGGMNPYSTPNQSLLSNGTPNGSSREPSGAPRSASKTNGKRTAEVIDLTLSSDEDDAPIVRAPKRQYPGPESNGSGLNYPPAPSYNY